MQKRLIVSAVVGLLALGFVIVSGDAPAEKQQTFLSALKEGQSISIKQDAGRYEISTLEGVPGDQGHKILEIGSDYLVVEDIAGVTETHIPLNSIKAIVRLKLASK